MENTRPPNHISPSASPPPPPLGLCPGSATLIALPCLYSILFLTGLPGNTLALWVFLRRISDRAPTQVYLSHLSASNLLVSLTAPFMAVYYVQAATRPAASLLCQLVLHGATPMLHVNIQLSVGLLTWVALSRLAALTRCTPGHFAQRWWPAFLDRLRRASFARRVCVGAWVLVVGATTFVTLYYSLTETRSGRGPEPGRGGGANHSRVSGDKEEEEVALCFSPATELGGVLSKVGQVITITLFFACFLLVLLCYVLLLDHVRRARRNIQMASTQGLLRRVFRNIMVIKMVLIFCLLPYNVYKAIFISLVIDQGLYSYSASQKTQHCHPFSSLIEIKNLLLLLAIMRGSLDPVIYFLLDKSFRKQTFILLGLKTQTTTPQDGRAAQLPGLAELGTDTPSADNML
ncbi:probable G-protein coupled receptor 82 [Gadus morhua]|uniref:probable G-protein coupled receptor 82 n=1 Tax=Gadus morhua TaxID=8049 RepID=UPI0011B7F7D0|nr:probable G-protein coupled receptor 82 [Gadus morhua]